MDTQTADLLRNQIISGKLGAGERLTEVQIADQFQLSRGTIRSALQELKKEGLVDQLPYRGWAVSELTIRDAFELQSLRSALEALAAKLVAQTIDDTKKKRLNAAFSQLCLKAKSSNAREAAVADYDLHFCTVQLSGHKHLFDMYKLMGGQVQRYIYEANMLVENGDELIAQHAPIIDAIASGDAKKSEQLAYEHNEKEGHKLVDCLEGALIKRATKR
ncbi:GntR family transcriptional regulator [Kiloniella spongiae]|uniref:GntR family transcriptional regulator n=1 Tax=Kiloniella spongiae TaxID=1489064 RepID=UPI00138E2038|nr:GntR family transcriptional regulator [Kiloniella spongiae]